MSKRIAFSLLGGALSAGICLAASQIIFGFPGITWSVISMTVANRLLLGFLIGISGWDIEDYLHGALLGLIVSLTVSIGFLPAEPLKFFLYTGAGVLYGLLIEFLSSGILKQPRKLP